MKYTVLLQYPDYLAENHYGEDLYTAHVFADHPDEAAEIAQNNAIHNHPDDVIEDPNDFRVIFVCRGHHDNLAP